MELYDEFLKLIYLIVYQFGLIFPYWITGVFAGSLISVFAAARITNAVSSMDSSKYCLVGAISAAVLGAASPICMYGTVPLIVSLGKKGVPQYLLAAFMVSSILINPNLFIFSFALGVPIALTRLAVCIAAGTLAGVLTRLFFKGRALFSFEGFDEKRKCRDQSAKIWVLVGDLHRGIVKTAPYFLFGIILTALFDRFLPKDLMMGLFGNNKGFGILFAASLGVPVYVCGGGTIPLLKLWMDLGMSPGSALAFMISGPATKLTNLSAVKIILGARNFALYIVFNIVFAVVVGWIVDIAFILAGR